MDITQFGPGDAEALRAMVSVANAAMAVDAPWQHPATVASHDGMIRHGWDGEPPVPFLATMGSSAVGYATYDTSAWDNTHLAWFGIEIHPDHRGAGHGTALMEHLLERARHEGRTSVGIDAWEHQAATCFATRHGFDAKALDINRRQMLAEVDWDDVERLQREAARPAAAYELVRRFGPTPEAELDDLALMTAAINDAPTDDLDYEDEVFTGERVRDYEQAQLARGGRLYRVMARHRETEVLAGQSVVVVESERPHIGDQHDTSVVRGHRGHRLGLMLKTTMLQWLHESEPRLESIDTWNAESNDFMIGVNEQLGYRVLGRAVRFQRSLS